MQTGNTQLNVYTNTFNSETQNKKNVHVIRAQINGNPNTLFWIFFFTSIKCFHFFCGANFAIYKQWPNHFTYSDDDNSLLPIECVIKSQFDCYLQKCMLMTIVIDCEKEKMLSLQNNNWSKLVYTRYFIFFCVASLMTFSLTIFHINSIWKNNVFVCIFLLI